MAWIHETWSPQRESGGGGVSQSFATKSSRGRGTGPAKQPLSTTLLLSQSGTETITCLVCCCLHPFSSAFCVPSHLFSLSGRTCAHCYLSVSPVTLYSHGFIDCRAGRELMDLWAPLNITDGQTTPQKGVVTWAQSLSELGQSRG